MTSLHLLFLFSSCFIFSTLGVDERRFPDDFLFGVATSSYQIEGGWNEDGKGQSIWDWYTHRQPQNIIDRGTGDIACDSYHKWQDDVELLKTLGVQHYRFSISWPRILPDGFAHRINEAGVSYYNNLTNALIENNIQPIITLYHWDLPLNLHWLGGWENDDSVQWFADYARIVFNLFGDRVNYWITFNEPMSFCQGGYAGNAAPGYNVDGVGTYLCTHNVLKAHAAAFHIYHDELNLTGRVSLVTNVDMAIPLTNSFEDMEAANQALQFWLGLYAHPIYIGNYPQVVIDRIEARSLAEGFPKSRLPEFTEEEINYIRGTADFFALNSYGSALVSSTTEASYEAEPSWAKDSGIAVSYNETWQTAASDWIHVNPNGMRTLLKYIKDTYNDTDILITENGYSDSTGTYDDGHRINYLRDYLSSILEAIYDDEVKVIGYTVWSLLDNFEWNDGYTIKFGLYRVNFADPERSRSQKDSGAYYQTVIETRCLDAACLNNP